ncbi:hypothetical protein [Paraburkholderia sp. SIMBA_054]|uniref:hypothetical protein n=1 Tax=Paraburkholderia sp. SIMBA_054 TaxID=3085795 RepID=UPI003978E281
MSSIRFFWIGEESEIFVAARESFRLALRGYGAECNASIDASKMDAARDRVLELYDRAALSARASEAVAGDPVARDWRVGLFKSSSDPRKQVRVLADGVERIAEYEQHHSFIRWIDAAPAQPFAYYRDCTYSSGTTMREYNRVNEFGDGGEGFPLYTAPPAASGQKLTDAQVEALKHLVAKGSSFPDHNGASGSVTRVDYQHLQEAAKVLSALLRASDSATASDKEGA